MALSGLPEDLARQVREARPRKLVEKDLEKRRRLEEEEERRFTDDGTMRPVEAAERLIVRRMSDCDLLLRAVKASANVLEKSGKELQRISNVVKGDKGFKRSLASGDPPIAQAGLGALDAFTGLGAALVALSAALAGDTFGGLQEIRQGFRATVGDALAEIALLEQQEDKCNESVDEVNVQKERLDVEIASQTLEHETYEQGGVSSWFKKPSKTLLQKTLQAQTTLIEELATRVDLATAAKSTTKKKTDAFKAKMREIDTKSKTQMRGVFKQCAASWETSVHAIEGTIVRLRTDTTAAAAAAAAASAPSPSKPKNANDAGQSSEQGGEGGGFNEELNDVEVCFAESDGEGSDHTEAQPPAQAIGKPQQKRQPSASPTRDEFGAGRGKPNASAAMLEELASEAANSLPMPPMARSASPDVGGDLPEKRTKITFGVEVKKLGFEVLWDSEWPCVLKVLPDGEAMRVGLCRGDIIREIQGASTRGRGRDELMPLLKNRPLALVLDTARRNSRAASPDAHD